MRYYFTVSENNLICISAPAAMHAYFRTALRLRSFVALGGKRQDMNSINKLTLCIPMYNESSIIADTVKTLTAALEQYREGGAYRRWELIVSDDGSTDGSADIVRSLGQSGVRICGYEHNRGKGCAVRTAMLEASREDGSPEHVIMFTDANLAYGTEVIDRFARAFAQHRDTDIFIGSRNLSGDGYESYTFIRRIASKAYIRLLCIVGGFKLSDSQCGCKAFRAPTAEQIFSRMETDGFAFDFEALLLAGRLGSRIGEIPVSVINHRESKIRLGRDVFKMAHDLFKMKRRVSKIKL